MMNSERFHQDLAKMEQWYQGKWEPVMLGITAGFSVRKMQLSIKEGSKHPWQFLSSSFSYGI
jgi:hypothetical protein